MRNFSACSEDFPEGYECIRPLGSDVANAKVSIFIFMTYTDDKRIDSNKISLSKFDSDNCCAKRLINESEFVVTIWQHF